MMILGEDKIVGVSIIEEEAISKQLNKMMGWFGNRSSANCYLINLIGLIGATIAGVKPAELLNIPTGNGRMKQSHWEECRLCLLRYNKLRIREINRRDGRKQVLFYHYVSLDNVLSCEANLTFLREIGYPEQYSVESYVDFLMEKLHGKNFPHDIGIFLGYPLKDVLGFAGYSSLRLTRRRGWNFYGDEETSNKRYESFLQARTRVKELACSLASLKKS